MKTKKVLIDIGHPAHIHYFKNLVRIMEVKGFDFLFVVREREATIDLIEQAGFNYISRGKGRNGMFGKFCNMIKTDFKIYKIARCFKPDLFLSFSSPYAAHVAFLMRKTHIAVDDTEHAKLEHMLYRPFTDIILSPSVYNGKTHKGQLFFNAYLELCYLHPNYFTPDRSILQEIGVKEGEKYVVLRFISWDASHDVGAKGFSIEEKIKIVKALEPHCRVFISSEKSVPKELECYVLRTHPSRFHDVLSYAFLHIGEGATTASESAVLGVPTIYTNSLKASNCADEEKYGLLYQINNCDSVIAKAWELLKENETVYKERRKTLLMEKIDPTSFLVWFIDHYPDSVKVMRENPNFQHRFK